MKATLWAVEQLVLDMMLLDAYLLLRSLGCDQEKLHIVGLGTKQTLRGMVSRSHELATSKVGTLQVNVFCDGGPTGRHQYVLHLQNYIIDRILRAIVLHGKAKVLRLLDEVIKNVQSVS
jgi:hypothetical protein